VLCLSLDLALVAARANHAVRGGNSVDELVSTQERTNTIILTEVEGHLSIRVRAAHNTLCVTQYTPSSRPIRVLVARARHEAVGYGLLLRWKTYRMVYTFRFRLEEHHTSSAVGKPVAHVSNSVCESISIG